MKRINRLNLARFAIVLGAAAFLIKVRTILVPFLLAAIIAYILEPPVAYLQKRGMKRSVAIFLLYLLLLAAGSLGCYFIFPGFIRELNNLSQSIPGFVQSLRDFSDMLRSNYHGAGLPESISLIIDEAIVNLQFRALGFIRAIVDNLVKISSFAFSALIAPILAFYILKDLELFRREIIAVLPDSHFRSWLELVKNIDSVVSGFIRGQLLVGAFVALAVMATMSALGIRFAIVLGIISGLGEFIPYFGPILASIPSVLLGLARSPLTGLEVILVFVIIQQIDSTIIGPRILGERVGLHPLTVIFSVLSGGYLFGVWGMFLAVPVAGIIKESCIFIRKRYIDGS